MTKSSHDYPKSLLVLLACLLLSLGCKRDVEWKSVRFKFQPNVGHGNLLINPRDLTDMRKFQNALTNCLNITNLANAYDEIYWVQSDIKDLSFDLVVRNPKLDKVTMVNCISNILLQIVADFQGKTTISNTDQESVHRQYSP